jgi:CDP-diacylglycerol--glycerol-3-phosphate 3-phosphatidyltransferase
VNLPNALTLSRLAAIPFVMALLLVRFEGHDQLAAALFILFSLTDTADGQIARRRRMVSDLGKFLDPLADKLYVLSVLIVLVQEGLVAAWVVVVIFARELVITLLRSVGARQGLVIAAAPLGKTKTILQMSAVVFLILQRPYPFLVPIAAIVLAFAVLLTVVSGIEYLWRLRRLIRPAPAGASPADPLAVELGGLLGRNHMTIAVAESCTGGLLGSLITDVPGSSAYFLGGAIAYADDVKRDELEVPASLLTKHGAVSREVAIAMAEGARSRFSSALGASITCIAGPDAAGSDKPVGLTYIAIASARGTRCDEHLFHGDRWSNRREAAAQALRSLIEEVATAPQTSERKPA